MRLCCLYSFGFCSVFFLLLLVSGCKERVACFNKILKHCLKFRNAITELP